MMEVLSIFEFIGLMITCSLVSVGFYAACQFDGDEAYDSADTWIKKRWTMPEPHNKMILWWVRWHLGRSIPKFWTKPIYACLPCMGSLHSVFPTWLYLEYTFFYMPYDFFMIYPIVALGTVGINYLIQTVAWK